MKTFFYVIGQIICYFAVMVGTVAILIALGYLLGCVISVREGESPSTSGVCTSTLCQ